MRRYRRRWSIIKSREPFLFLTRLPLFLQARQSVCSCAKFKNNSSVQTIITCHSFQKNTTYYCCRRKGIETLLKIVQKKHFSAPVYKTYLLVTRIFSIMLFLGIKTGNAEFIENCYLSTRAGTNKKLQLSLLFWVYLKVARI